MVKGKTDIRHDPCCSRRSRQMDVIYHHCHDLPVAFPGQGSVTCSPLQGNDTLVIPTACRAQSKEWVTFHLPRAVQNETQEEKERQMHFRYRQPLKYKAPQSLIHFALGGTGRVGGDTPPCLCWGCRRGRAGSNSRAAAQGKGPGSSIFFTLHLPTSLPLRLIIRAVSSWKGISLTSRPSLETAPSPPLRAALFVDR